MPVSRHVKLLADALRANPDTRWHGILTERKVVETERGHLSFERDRELLALVCDDPKEGYAYGHVLRVDPADLGRDPGDGPVWAALILFVHRRIEADTEDLLFRRCRYWIQTKGKYTPCHAQERDDVFALADSFGEAVFALAEMIRRFDQALRDGLPHGQPDDGIRYVLDMRCFDVYGGIMTSWDGNDPESEAAHELSP